MKLLRLLESFIDIFVDLVYKMGKDPSKKP